MSKKLITKPINIQNKDKVMKKAVTAKDKKWLALSMEDQPIVTAPIIDKLSVVIDIPDVKLLGMITHGLLAELEENEPGFIKVKGSARYPLAVKIICPDHNGIFNKDGPSVLLQVTRKEFPKPQIRLEFNPHKLFSPMNALGLWLGDPIQEYLDVHFQGLCGQTFFELLSHAFVTRIDICRTIMDRSPENYLFRTKYKQTCNTHFGKGGRLETIYFGKSSGNQVTVYDKEQQLSGGKSDKHSIRIERMIKPMKTKMPIHELWNLTNPFNGIGVYSLHVKQPPFGQGHWYAFQDACRFRGITKAIARQPKEIQAKLRKVIANQPVNWWNIPDDDWTDLWHEALSDAWLNRIPNSASPLTLQNVVGMAA